MSVEDFLTGAVAGGADAPALCSLEGTWSYAELDRWVDACAAELRAGGVGPGAVAPVVLESTADGIVHLLALWRAGVVPAPLNPTLTAAERTVAEEALARSGAPDEAQALVWTSGTEGTPRGVALTAENLRASARAAAARLDLGPDDTWLASLSLAHVGGLALVVRSLLLGGLLVAVGRFTASLASRLIDGEGGVGGDGVPEPPGAAVPGGRGRPGPPPVTHVSLVPTQLLRVLDLREGRPPPPTFRCALLGGAHAPEDLVARAVGEGWPIALTYGATEMTSQVATAPPALVVSKPGTVGAPLEGVELRLGVGGEILARGSTRALGYVAASDMLSDADGWYHTGDLGRLDDDGHLWVTGRRSERIVSGGVTVDPLEVEDALRAHPSVVDACVVGLPDGEWGEVVAAAVVPSGPALDVDALAAWVRERLAPAKRPRRWTVVEDLPRNANGKVSRRSVRAGLEGGAPTA